VLCAVTIMSFADLLSLSIYFVMWLYVYIIYLCVCLVLLSVEDLFVEDKLLVTIGFAKAYNIQDVGLNLSIN
jgi:hypothetical protein